MMIGAEEVGGGEVGGLLWMFLGAMFEGDGWIGE